MSFDYKTYFLSDLSKHFETCPACEYNQASVANGFLFPFSKITCAITVKFYFIIFGNGIICIHCTRVHVLYFIFGSVYYFNKLFLFKIFVFWVCQGKPLSHIHFSSLLCYVHSLPCGFLHRLLFHFFGILVFHVSIFSLL